MSKFDRVAGIINQAPRHWGEEAVLKTAAEVSALFHISTIHFIKLFWVYLWLKLVEACQNLIELLES